MPSSTGLNNNYDEHLGSTKVTSCSNHVPCNEADEPIKINEKLCTQPSNPNFPLFKKLVNVPKSSVQSPPKPIGIIEKAPLTNYFSMNYCNIRSLFNKLNFINNYLYTENVDILFLTESWLTINISDSMVCPQNYSLIRRDRVKFKGGGVCVFYKNLLKVNEIRCNETNTTLDDKFEYVCIDLHDGKLPIRVCCFYIPPSSSPILEDVSHFKVVSRICSIITKLSSSIATPFYLIGDFNLPSINWTIPTSIGDEAHDLFLTFCLSKSFCQFIDVPTHIKGNILDLLLCNPPAKEHLLNYCVHPPMSSTCDHNVIYFQIERQNNIVENVTINCPNYSTANYSQIYQNLIDTKWDSIINSDLTLQQNYDSFLSILYSEIAKHVPVNKTKSFNSVKKPHHIRRLLKEKLRVYKQCKHNKALKQKFKQLSKEYETAVKEWHNNTESNICNNPSSKKFYKYVKQKIKSKAPVPPLYDDQDNLVMSDSNKANLFNSFFQHVFTQDDGRKTDQTTKKVIEMNNYDITYDEILDAVYNSKDKISRTPDKIPMYFIKRVLGPILKPLLFLFNSFLKFNFVPEQWKQAIVIPIFKKGNRNRVQNYRPISLTSSFCRIFESIMSKRILSHLQTNSLLSSKQFGFLPNKSTYSNLLSCYHKWLISFSSNITTNVIYTDISKAFDTVSHSKLLDILQKYGLHTTVLHWLQNFLNNRYQQVAIGNALSNPLPVSSGVPQGSVIGPLLFTIYIDDITNCSNILHNTGDIALFADDAKLFSTDSKLLQTSLDHLVTWTKNRQLNLAPNKCFSLQICKPSRQLQEHFIIDDYTLSSTSAMKDLGIFISSDLKWTTHIFSIYKNAALVSYQLLKSFKTRNFATLLKLYTTYVRPKLEHNTSLWSPSLKKDIMKIESIQRSYTKRIFMRCGISFSSYTDRLKKANLKSLQYRRSIFDLQLLFKIINGFSDLNFNDYFIFRNLTYNIRGNTKKIDTIHHFNNSNWNNSFFVRAARLWNLLPDKICSSKSLNEFKNNINNFDLSPYIHQFLE
jgi:hypothetical protein